jgi:bleomycin hydrolase
MKYLTTLAFVLILIFSGQLLSQDNKDKAEFREKKNNFWDEIKKSQEEFNQKPKKPNPKFMMDFSNVNIPKSSEEFDKAWHNPPVSQGSTNTCWAFSTTSFLESEYYRINKKEIKFSVMFTVYWEYVEKARRFVQERGNSNFGEGSEANAVTRIWKKYGCVPEEEYITLKPGQKFHDHEKLFAELNEYLQNVKKSGNWNEEEIISTVKAILNYHLGTPPNQINYNGKKITPGEFLRNEIKINPDDYVDLMSLMEKPYFQKAEYEVPDNWWKSSDYYNVPLDDFMNALVDAVKDGYTVAIGGDVSEPGIDGNYGIAVVPTFDIPSEYIDQYSREFRFNNQTTTDDHGIHLVGYKKDNGKYWFLIKDSGSGSHNNPHASGYYFYYEDYVKLKMMSFMVHRSAVEKLLKKFK